MLDYTHGGFWGMVSWSKLWGLFMHSAFLKILLIISVTFVLGSCSTREERAANRAAYAAEQAYEAKQREIRFAAISKELEEKNKAQLIAEIKKLQAICHTYGYQYKTTKMADCVSGERQRNAQAQAEQRLRMDQALAAEQARKAAEQARKNRATAAAFEAFSDYADNYVAEENRRIERNNSRQNSRTTTRCTSFGSTLNCNSR